MSSFSFKDLESLKKSGSSVQDIHYRLSNAILNCEMLNTDVRTLDRSSGRYEIVVTGTISKPVIDTWSKNEGRM